MDDALRERIEALERAVTDGDHDLSGLADDAKALDRLDAVEERIEKIETRVDELEAATQALRGYVGNVRSVNQDVEQRADAALAKAESLETAVTGSGPATKDRDSSDDRSMGVDERLSRSDQQTDDSAVSHQQRTTTLSERTSATPDGGLTSTSSTGETTAGRQRCHACGKPHTSDDHERPRDSKEADSLTAQSMFDKRGVDTGTGTGGRDAFPEDTTSGDGTRKEGDCDDIVPESDPLVADDDETGGLRRLRELL